MNQLPIKVLIATVIVVLVVAVGVLSIVRRGKYCGDFLLWWPILLYVPGPVAAYFIFSGGIFDGYITDGSVLAATLILVVGFLIFRVWLRKGTSRNISDELVALSKSRTANGQRWPFVILGSVCALTQLLLIKSTGSSILSGSYILADGGFAENSSLFTVAAGLYELFSALLAFRLVSQRNIQKADWGFYLYCFFVLSLRALGGTRLVLLKLLLFVMIVMLLKNRITLRKAGIYAVFLVAAFSIVGALRGSSGEDGLLFLLFAEPALGNLSATYVTQYYIENGFYFGLESIGHLFTYSLFVLIHLLPNFIYKLLGGEIILLGDWGYYRSWGDAFYPFRTILLETGLETVSPVGGQSIVALGVALFGVLGGALIIPLLYGLFYGLKKLIPVNFPLILIVGFEAPSIFRDATEILIKQIFMIAIAYAIFEVICRVRLVRSGLNRQEV